MATTRSIPVWVALLGSATAGVLVAGQSRINGGLGKGLENGFLAAGISFVGGLLVMLIVISISRTGRRGIREVTGLVRAGQFPWWGLLGGLGGAMLVFSQSVTVGVLGVAMYTVGIVGGQILAGIIIDRIGIGPSGTVRATPARVIGAVLALVAVLVSVWSGLSGTTNQLWLLMPLIAGAAVAWQSAVNGLVRAAAQSTATATFFNFLVGATVLSIAALVSVAVSGWPEVWPTNPILYLGGPMGCIFIAAATLFVRSAGVLLLSMSNVAGQLIGAIIMDAVAPVANGLSVGMLAGAGIALVAVLVASVGTKGSGRGTAPAA
ncbi:DMT family transporter [Leucobacter sp. M11]|uniref:DMT family transporter n=1 Tax=Leucobacter sp. M11 TaxID=2993565 RepID=UPI002D7F42AB|nr:DMT family transporter [Leucobacter sp. M11]MEB4615463.1 DMT family transporter [Leucobacter sp. M11]